MEVLDKVRNWCKGLAELGVSVAALLIILEVLGAGTIPFVPATSVVANVTTILAGLGSQGLIGLVAIWVLYEIWSKR